MKLVTELNHEYKTLNVSFIHNVKCQDFDIEKTFEQKNISAAERKLFPIKALQS